MSSGDTGREKLLIRHRELEQTARLVFVKIDELTIGVW